ncbi:MAG: 23S rRNA (pseudouridine(1915)-N(3))-methyltransferase RlmH [Rhizobiaceae bacterium]
MRIAVHAVGRMKAGPEQDLAARYFDRFSKAGGSLGFDFSGVVEIAESRASGVEERRRDEAAALTRHLQPGAVLVLLDETGRNLSSQDFCGRLAAWRDGGAKALTVAIGGPDGHDRSLKERADLVLSFGAATWPHQIVRVMLAEQLYRAATILAGHPYHRG